MSYKNAFTEFSLVNAFFCCMNDENFQKKLIHENLFTRQIVFNFFHLSA